MRDVLRELRSQWALRGPLRPFFNGRLVAGQVCPNLISTIVLALIPGGLEIRFYIRPLQGGRGPSALLHTRLGLSACVLLGSIVILTVYTALRNPGLVAKAEKVPEGLKAEELDDHGWPR